LAYHANEVPLLPGGVDPGNPYQHRIRVTGLQEGTTYSYSVVQGAETFNGTFKTIPDQNSSVRFVVYGDSETEPESTGAKVNWEVPFSSTSRQYVVDQTEGYKQNLNIIESRNPDFIGIAGDIVESGGEQRDWDEFWRHNSGSYNDVASHIPILAAPGNHENFGGPGGLGGYSDAAAIRARDKFSTYFEAPDNGSGVSTFEDRYFRVDYGPITYIVLDVTNGANHATSSDTNWLLANGAGIPDFNPGSTQYAWLEAQLADAESKSQFTFVQFHHVPYSVGPHGFPAGNGGNSAGFDTQSGQPVRILTSLFQQYGVDAVFSGHDEQYQHSIVSGIHFFDVGIGGDGLRGPSSGTDGSTGLASTNPYQVFTAHLDAPEVWSGAQLVSGGKHYGHMEVDVFIDTDGFWKASLEAAYSFPLMDSSGNVTGWERRVYSDAVTLVGVEANVAPVLDADGSPTLDSILGNVANANNPGTLISDIIARMGPDGGITDANTNPSFGIAINGATNTANGTWQYSTDGGTNWSDIGPVSNDAARLLASDANTRLRFVPNAGFLGEAKVAFVAWDQTEGVNGGTGITKGRGGHSTFSLSYDYASIFVVNAAPVLNNSGNPMLDQITLNVPGGSNPGTLVSDIIARMGPSGGITDANPGALSGIAINGLTNTANGSWQFTVNNGTNWTPFSVAGNFDARLLYADGNTRIRYVPNGGFLGEAKFAFVAWDRTTGANGGVANVNNRGGTTPYSLAYEYASIKVVNTAPVLTPSNSSTFDGILMNEPAGSNPGTLVSTLISRMGPSGGITDADPGTSLGIAVVGMTGTSTGTWQYTINGGTTWAALGAPSSSVARLLAADGNTRIRYVPNAGFVGIAKIAFVGWDQTSGTNGAIVNAAGRGGTKPYSLAYDYASIAVENAAPVLTPS
ncbi:MAG: metallophosphoesterase, partial [Planctomycetaceae bacterium]|nr:metallophosphoesterase [Planctomycetaceae bacterium]